MQEISITVPAKDFVAACKRDKRCQALEIKLAGLLEHREQHVKKQRGLRKELDAALWKYEKQTRHILMHTRLYGDLREAMGRRKAYIFNMEVKRQRTKMRAEFNKLARKRGLSI